MSDSRFRLLRFDNAVRHDPAIDLWFEGKPPELARLIRPWFGKMRSLGDDIRELLHDGHPTACVGDAALCYVNAFTAHANVGFFLGAWLDDPCGLLEGTGKRMRHVKLAPGRQSESAEIAALIERAYTDMHERLQTGAL